MIRVSCEANEYTFGPYIRYSDAAEIFADHLDCLMHNIYSIQYKRYTSSIIEYFIDHEAGKPEPISTKVTEYR